MLLKVAALTARAWHAGYFRRDGTTPYINHPRQVARRVQHESVHVRVLAWVHDLLEDTSITIGHLRNLGFPDDVLEALVAITHVKGEPNLAYWKRVKANPIALRVKIADMIENLSDAPTDHQRLKYTQGLDFLILRQDI